MEQAKVNSQSAVVAKMAVHWPMLDALLGGTHAMRTAGPALLPQWPNEVEDSYKSRLKIATLFPAFERTVAVMAAKPFARPMSFETEPPARVAELFENVDLIGSDLHGYSFGLMRQCLSHGLCGALVDFPEVSGMGVRSRADEKRLGLRPYFATYPAASILGWRSRRSPEGVTFEQLRLLESVSEPDGEWGEKEVTQVRVLYPGRWQVWRQSKAGEWFVFQEGVTPLRRIPFVFFYGLKQGFGIGAPPLIDLAYLNVEHWQSSSDQQNILNVARVPILFAKGFTDADQLTIGAYSAVRALSAQSELSYVEHSGAAIDAGRQSLLDLEDRMRQSGAELLVQRPAVATATQVRSESEANRSTLQQITEDFEDSLETAISLLAEWRGEAYAPEIEMFKDFGAAELTDKVGDLLLRATSQGVISRETTFKQLQRTDVVDPAVEWEEEKTRLDEEGSQADKRDVAKATMMSKAQPPMKPPK